jgi:hypothetical protein
MGISILVIVPAILARIMANKNQRIRGLSKGFLAWICDIAEYPVFAHP